MLSGNGRHRRPRQAPALLVAAGVTGSAIAIPLLGASGASAADGTVWDQVAECESGGSWSADNGNGYYGGLQISQDDWEAYGGLGYAASADLASRSQQIAVAERILADRGPGAWPACGLLSGLSQDSDAADVDTGVAEDASPAPSTSPSSSGGDSSDSASGESDGTDKGKSTKSDKSPESDSGVDSGSDDDGADSGSSGDGDNSSAPHSSSTPATKSDDSDNSLQEGDSSEASGGGGRHRGDSADEDPADVDRSESSGRHASRASGDAREVTDGSYTVQPGDNLTYIADSLDLSGGWRALYRANQEAVGADPDLIIPGQTLEVGVEPGEK
ncbi:transglycosylase family protein [Streptomyces sp. B93]|uniref:LysM peptidoglycan-binding domain-containing protein n=1 Tax=Streptomyces sp. B93 TaxID=2824875 RepID=UPI001B3720C0|nr:transglycosylase family protein [Streptomyces sp. B93]MBQ1089529.1 LysM peptidoglycan-binding domain-containing protein [Streptomyces sp. B93]